MIDAFVKGWGKGVVVCGLSGCNVTSHEGKQQHALPTPFFFLLSRMQTPHFLLL
jgi:hypothetical protein